MKRLGIYVFYDENGIVDEYIPYFLDDLCLNLDELLIVCNGNLTSNGSQLFKKYTPYILIRENKGLDIGGYKDAMLFLGWERLEEFDEVILVNDTIMGPVYPFSEMFAEMEHRELDFWGMTRHCETHDHNFYNCKYGYIPEHIQSYFMVFRKRFVKSKDFHTYWENQPYYDNYNRVVGEHELVFTKYFSDLGYRWDTYINHSAVQEKSYSPIMMYPTELVRDNKCPVFKKRVFFQEYQWVLDTSVGQHAMRLYNYLEKDTEYPVNLILDSLIRSRHLVDLYRNFHWLYILPKDYIKNCRLSPKTKVGIIVFMHYPDMIEVMCDYLLNVPEFIDLYVYTNSVEKAEKIRRSCLDRVLSIKKIEVVPNRGRDMGCLLVEAKKYIFDYNYIGFVHDKKSMHISSASVAESFFYKCMENMLGSASYIYNILDVFEKNEKLGILSPLEPNHSEFRNMIGHEWGWNYPVARQLAEELNLTAPMSEKVVPVAPLGDYFWFRPEALKPLYRKEWNYDDFPEEPINVDGTILHAIERIYPFVAQTAGYYSGHILTDEFAVGECINLEYQLASKPDGRDLVEETRQVYLNSTCWKITAPIRWLMNLVKKHQ